tara:strand:- start:1362 stop:1592 length:231 start_codon:yes stop_codon:yes gene_type:complete
MIENALSYKQESRGFNSNCLRKRLKGFVLDINIYGGAFVLLIIACLLIPPIVKSINLVDVNKINDYVILSIIDDFK